jgi:transposase
MVVDGFLRNGDVLVIDNASIHRYHASAVLEEILWEDYKILLIFMPARSPELNPIELMWNILVQRLRRVPLTGRHILERNALAAKDSMDTFAHSEVASCYQKCNYI